MQSLFFGEPHAIPFLLETLWSPARVPDCA
jgi:hypothetical protein